MWGRCDAVSVAAAASRRAEGEPEGSRESPGCAPHDDVYVEDSSPVKATLVPSLSVWFLGQKRHEQSKLFPPTLPPARSRQPPPPSSDAARRHRRRDGGAHAGRAESFPAGLHQRASNCLRSARPAQEGVPP